MTTDLENEIRANLRDGKLPCAVAWRIAERMGVERRAVGEMADALEIRISHCQLGLFGYGEKRLGQHKILKQPESPDPALADALRAAAHDGKITCAQLFDIAGRLGRPPMDASGHAEALGIKIAQCQLGCF
ncbi:MAG: hypothetical protein Kow00123_02930 [Anaerolineales bacterium]